MQTQQQAHDWYASEDYAELKALQLAASEANAVFIEDSQPIFQKNASSNFLTKAPH